jgi:hypothetical protein
MLVLWQIISKLSGNISFYWEARRPQSLNPPAASRPSKKQLQPIKHSNVGSTAHS